ncbi:MAG: type IV secretion system DNA-binding domain-containing protein [Candidatus Magasanikbacteria bacterium]|nr:type IV secretion system DNA-binding domain-containing protein [Candidatus Magasanikbacteria bacterium]
MHAKGAKTEQRDEDLCLFAKTNFRNQMRRFGIKTDDRRRHTYIIGKTGMGKTTMMENMVLQDIYKGHGVGVVDPHGDFAEKIIDYIPSHRINDVVYFNPADIQFPIGFNVLEVKSEEQRHLVAAGLMGIFKKIWPDVWSSRMEYILNNTLAALLEYPGSTLLGINRLLAEKSYRRRVIKKLTDPVIRSFWQNEFAQYNDRYAQEAVAPIQNKIGQFLSANVIRNMVAQVKSTINIRDIMDEGKIFIMNLSKGRIGEDNSRLLGGMLITKIQLAAMERVDMPEEKRKDFFLYVDEFQNFATPSFANILSEARKYRLSLIMAHQYVAQLDELVADAVFGNVGTIVTFRVGGADAEKLVREFTPTFTEDDIVNLAKFHIFLKLMIDGVASQPFSAVTMPPIGSPTESKEKVIKVSRERYGKPRDVIEDKILRWSGMEDSDEDSSGNKSKQGKQQYDKKNKTKKNQNYNKNSSRDRSNNQRQGNDKKREVTKKKSNTKPNTKKENFVSLSDLKKKTEKNNQSKNSSKNTSGNQVQDNKKNFQRSEKSRDTKKFDKNRRAKNDSQPKNNKKSGKLSPDQVIEFD